MSTLTPMSISTYDRASALDGSSEVDAVALPMSWTPSASVRSVGKRAMDLTGSVLGWFLLSPVRAVVAVLIRLESKGPILFRQERMGLCGRVFWCLKFRTM